MIEGPARQQGWQRWRRSSKDQIPLEVYVNGWVPRGRGLTAYWLRKSDRLERIADNLHSQHVVVVEELHEPGRTWRLCGKEQDEYTALVRRENP